LSNGCLIERSRSGKSGLHPLGPTDESSRESQSTGFRNQTVWWFSHRYASMLVLKKERPRFAVKSTACPDLSAQLFDHVAGVGSERSKSSRTQETQPHCTRHTGTCVSSVTAPCVRLWGSSRIDTRPWGSCARCQCDDSMLELDRFLNRNGVHDPAQSLTKA
jgi:hypothetical protein